MVKISNIIKSYFSAIQPNNSSNKKKSRVLDVSDTKLNKIKNYVNTTFCYSFLCKEKIEKLKEAKFNKYILESGLNGSLNKEAKNEYIKLFRKVLHLGDDYLLKLREGESAILNKEVENLLSEDLGQLRSEKEEILKLPSTDQTKQKQLEEVKLAIRIEKAKLAKLIGIDFVVNKGATGTLLIKNLKGKNIGVFKPTHEFTPTKAKILNSIKRIFGGQLFYLSHKTDAQAKAEVAAYKLDRHFGFNLSPSSKFLEEFDGKQGTFQSFFKGFQEAKEFLDLDSESTALPSLEEKANPFSVTDFQKMALFDYLIGNLDRKEDNWGVAQIKGDDGKIKTQLKVIDSANAFLCKNPLAGKVKNQYKWKLLPMAQEKWTPETLNFIRDHLTEKSMHEFIEEMKKDGFLNEQMEQNLRDRLGVIRSTAAQAGNTPAMLGNIVSDADILFHLKP